MTFKELLETVDIEELKKYIKSRVEKQDEYDSFVKMIDSLLSREVVEESKKLVLALIPQYDYFSEEDDENNLYLNVYGVDETKECFALDFTPWDKWLGFPILQKSIDEFGVFSFIFNCLNEMSFISFDEEDIQSEVTKLNEISEGVKNGTIKTYSWEEVVSDLKEKYEDFEIPELSKEEKEKRNKHIKDLMEKNNQLKEIFLKELN